MRPATSVRADRRTVRQAVSRSVPTPLSKALNDARDDKSIKAIVIRVDSPGGSGLASDIIWHAVETAKEKKPVVVSMSDVAASGGYYISASASKIVAQPSTITGSIGVVAGKPVMRGFYDWLGISNEYVLRGKTCGHVSRDGEIFPEERAKFEEWIKTTYYEDFVPKVAKGRNKDAQYIDSVAQGRVWTGSQGKERGLVDEFGGLDRAIEVAKELAKIPKDKGVHRVILPYPRTFLQELLSGGDENSNTQVEQQQAVLAALPEDARRALRYMAMLDRMKNGESMLLMPFDLQSQVRSGLVSSQSAVGHLNDTVVASLARVPLSEVPIADKCPMHWTVTL